MNWIKFNKYLRYWSIKKENIYRTESFLKKKRKLLNSNSLNIFFEFFSPAILLEMFAR